MESLIKSISASAVVWGLIYFISWRLKNTALLNQLWGFALPLGLAAGHFFLLPPQWPPVDAMSFLFYGWIILPISFVLTFLLTKVPTLNKQVLQLPIQIIFTFISIIAFAYLPFLKQEGIFQLTLLWLAVLIIGFYSSKRAISSTVKLTNFYFALLFFLLAAVFIFSYSSSLALLAGIAGGLHLANLIAGKILTIPLGAVNIQVPLALLVLLSALGAKLTAFDSTKISLFLVSLAFLPLQAIFQTRKKIFSWVIFIVCLTPLIYYVVQQAIEYNKS